MLQRKGRQSPVFKSVVNHMITKRMLLSNGYVRCTVVVRYSKIDYTQVHMLNKH